MSDLSFCRRDLLKTGSITLVGATGLIQSVDAQSTSGPTGDPTEIRDWHDLDAVRQNLDGDYIIVNDLDQTTAGYDEHVGNPAEGWNPIGEVDRNAVEFTSFTGQIDGNGHKITGLQINRPKETDLGLFAMIGEKTTISNLILTELDVTGKEFDPTVRADGESFWWDDFECFLDVFLDLFDRFDLGDVGIDDAHREILRERRLFEHVQLLVAAVAEFDVVLLDGVVEHLRMIPTC